MAITVLKYNENISTSVMMVMCCMAMSSKRYCIG